MNTKPILFSTEMVQAILEGRKTQTRRILKVKGCKPFIPDNSWDIDTILEWNKNYHPYGKIGDILWVRETYSNGHTENGIHTGYRYKANNPKFKVIWKPSLFMPKEACRLFLKITNVRVERLKDITEMDAIFEGCMQYDKNTDWMTALYGFEVLWKKINGENSWNSNPWVWVIDFERIEKPENF